MAIRQVIKKCPQCGVQMQTEIEDSEEDLFKSMCKMWKKIPCEVCGEFEGKAERVSKLKAEVWGKINTLEGKRSRLLAALEKGVVEPNAKQWLSKWDEQQQELKKQVAALDLKEREVLGQYGRHIKERTPNE